MNVLIIGGGGREHVLAWKLAESYRVDHVFVAPGNDGMEAVARTVPIAVTDHDGLIAFAKEHVIDLTIIGPEEPLLDGMADAFSAAGLRVFAPSQAAALIEGSKSFANDLMTKYGIPTATSQTFTIADDALEALQQYGAPVVVKADGLDAGKGVTVAKTETEAEAAIRHLFANDAQKVVMEDYLEGDEFTLMAFVHRDNVVPMALSQDHKRAFTGGKGPNTGGMGAYSPVPQLSEDIATAAVTTIMEPAARALVEEGRPFTGILYAGLIQTTDGVKVIEFNARFGDPEAQVVLPRMQDDLLDVIERVMAGESFDLTFTDDRCLGVVLAANGYPNAYEKGYELSHIDDVSRETLLFHAGTKKDQDQWVMSGGRLLTVVNTGPEIADVQNNVYRYMARLSNDSTFYRKDIGDNALNHVSAKAI